MRTEKRGEKRAVLLMWELPLNVKRQGAERLTNDSATSVNGNKRARYVFC